jgi:hypothetical protein
MTVTRGERLLAAVIRALPEQRRELGRAILAEAAFVPPGRPRAAWIAGGMWFVLKERAMRTYGYATGLAVAVAVLLWVDRSPSEIANQAALLVLLLTAAAMGFAAPRRAWLAGLLLGASIAVAHMVYLTLGPALPYKAEPAGLSGAATLLILIVPAVIAAYVGAGVARLVRGRHRPPGRPA